MALGWQALPEHSLVLKPHKMHDQCSVNVIFTSFYAQDTPAVLIVELHNPQVPSPPCCAQQLSYAGELWRCDDMERCGWEQIVLLLRFVADVLHGVDIAIAALLPQVATDRRAAAEAKPQPPQAQQEGQAKAGPPLQVVLHMVNASILLPASSSSREVCSSVLSWWLSSVEGDDQKATVAAELSPQSVSSQDKLSCTIPV